MSQQYLVLEKCKVLDTYGLRLLKCDCPLSIPEMVWVDQDVHDSAITGQRVMLELKLTEVSDSVRQFDSMRCLQFGAKAA